jgi:hypothetical protein
MQKIRFLPIAISLEELVENSGVEEFEIGDDFMAMNQMYDNLEFESLLVQVLNALSDRQKIVFVYQILRSLGFKVTQDSLRRTIHLPKNDYYATLREVKEVVSKTIKYSKSL